jgi:hypothetical protein
MKAQKKAVRTPQIILLLFESRKPWRFFRTVGTVASPLRTIECRKMVKHVFELAEQLGVLCELIRDDHIKEQIRVIVRELILW